MRITLRVSRGDMVADEWSSKKIATLFSDLQHLIRTQGFRITGSGSTPVSGLVREKHIEFSFWPQEGKGEQKEQAV